MLPLKPSNKDHCIRVGIISMPMAERCKQEKENSTCDIRTTPPCKISSLWSKVNF